jgi:crossover junction endodeoxyribonuclease RuvC
LIILGIDPGTAITGYGVICDDAKGALSRITHGCILTPSKETPALRLLTIHTELGVLIETYKPDVVSIEQLFFNRNVTTALSVGQARGVAMLSAAIRGIPVTEFTPLQVKQAVAGYGRADKQQVQNMVRALLRLDSIPKPDDAADALAIAICCAHHGRMSRVMFQGVKA